MSWIPFYWLGKCCGLALLLVPETNISSVLFERVVVWGMDNAHHFLGNLVVPNIVEFAVFLPWRLLHVVFPNTQTTFPYSAAGGDNGVDENSGSSGNSNGAGLAARLQHLQVPKRGAVDGDDFGKYPQSSESEGTPKQSHGERRLRSGSRSPPPLPPREPQASLNDAAAGVVASVGGELPPRLKSPWSLGEGRIFGHRGSLGEMVRATLTGDSKTRLRDHLFDLHSPAPPTPCEFSATDRRSSAAESRFTYDLGEGNLSSSAMSIDDREVKQKAKKKPAKKEVLGSVKRSGEASVLKEGTRILTRRRPSELTQNVSERVGTGGGDEAAGRGDGVVRRRNRLGRRGMSADEINTNVNALNSVSSMSASPSTRGANSGSLSRETSDTRAKRLEEWRKRRSKHIEAQAASLRRRGKKGTGANAAPGPVTTFATQPGSSTGGERANQTPSRRFRHVERFRSDVGKTAGDT